MPAHQRYLLIVSVVCLLAPRAGAQVNTLGWHMQPIAIPTRWAHDVSPTNALPEYPRPQMVRPRWTNLNGLWQYAITAQDAPAPTQYRGTILVPYPIESALSGVQQWLQPTQRLWYRRTFRRPALRVGERVLLQFGAVDWEARVVVNGTDVCHHRGGYTAFTCDVTDALRVGDNALVVAVADPSDKGPNPHGKQVLNPGGIMYTPSSGIWQTVWLEVVPQVSIASLRLTPDVDAQQVHITVDVPNAGQDYTVETRATNQQQIVGRVSGAVNTPLALPIPKAHLWSPDDPFLYDVTVRLLYKGTIVDSVTSYVGMRKIAIKKDAAGSERIFLNDRYTYNLGMLDQGFWPDGLYTAPTDDALQFDIKAIKAMGFNTIRKHIKIEPARWYYHCDRLGMLVWQDFVNPANDRPEARAAFETESQEMLTQLHNSPSITTWVVFNEGWGAYDQARLTQWVKSADPSRLVNGHTGENYFQGSPPELKDKWANSDLTDVHAYPDPESPDRLPGKARVVGEFGGIGVFIEGHLWDDATDGWGYIKITPGELVTRYGKMIDSLKRLEIAGLSGSIYTQPFDVEGEQNGLMTYDRAIIKIPAATLRQLHAPLVAATRNFTTATQGFSATVVDTSNPDRDYSARLAEYQRGKRDPVFLRRVALMAVRANDTTTAKSASAAYIGQITNPYTKSELSFLRRFTRRTTDPGFDLFWRHAAQVDTVLGPGKADVVVQMVLQNEFIKPYLKTHGDHPDWAALERQIVPTYGAVGEFIVWRIKTNGLKKQQDWPAMYAAAVSLIDKYGTQLSARDLNQFAWDVFEHVSDTTALRTALAWSRKAVTLEDSPDFYDTYANLLYRLGHTADAIAWEEKAVNKNPQRAEFSTALAKMRKGEPTWAGH